MEVAFGDGAKATSITLPSAPFIDVCASIICGGVETSGIRVLFTWVGKVSASAVVVVVPGNGSRGLGGKLPRPVMVNSPSCLLAVLPLGHI